MVAFGDSSSRWAQIGERLEPVDTSAADQRVEIRGRLGAVGILGEQPGSASKRGDPYLRTLLIHGARSVMLTQSRASRVMDRGSKRWLRDAQKRCGRGAGQQDSAYDLGTDGSWLNV